MMFLILPLTGCFSPGAGAPPYTVPTLADLATDADATLDEVDRAASLAGAAEADLAPEGLAPDLAGAPSGYLLDIDSGDVATLDDGVGTSGPADYENVVHGGAMVAIADANTALLLAVPAAAVGITTRGVVTQIQPNVWAATNTVSDGTSSVSGLFVVAWVGVGWLGEMRLWTSDGRYDDTRWFNGFLAQDGGLGWWDFYDTTGALTGVVEWAADDAGNGEFGIAATAGENAGDVLGYAFADGEGLVALYDASADEPYWVHVAADGSGDLRDPAWNGGVAACWNVDRVDVACPAE